MQIYNFTTFEDANLQFVNFKNPFRGSVNSADLFKGTNFKNANLYGAYLLPS